MSRRLVVVGRRRVVRVGFVAGLSLDLSFDLAEVLLQFPEIVVRQEARQCVVRPEGLQVHVRRPEEAAYTALGAEPLRCGVWGEQRVTGCQRFLCPLHARMRQSRPASSRKSQMPNDPAAGWAMEPGKGTVRERGKELGRGIARESAKGLGRGFA